MEETHEMNGKCDFCECLRNFVCFGGSLISLERTHDRNLTIGIGIGRSLASKPDLMDWDLIIAARRRCLR